MNPFERGILYEVTPTPTPRPASDRAPKSDRKKPDREPRTLFDVQEYLTHTRRSGLMKEIYDYDHPAVEHALAMDLDAAVTRGDADEVWRLRRMILIAATEGFPGNPDTDPEKLSFVAKDEIKTIQDRAAQLKRTGDYDSLDMEEDGLVIHDWLVLQDMFAYPQHKRSSQLYAAALRTLENALHYAYRDIQAARSSPQAKRRYAGLEKARAVAYWYALRQRDRDVGKQKTG